MKKGFAGIGICMLIGRVALATPTTDRPNILWLTCEDNHVSWVGCYGNPHAETPNIDRLAKEGFQYMNAYANAPVCAPSRSTWITGMLAISNGTFPMRSRNPIPHGRIPYYPDLLKANGYYVGNDNKTDYNIGGRADHACWDNPKKVNWEQLKNNQPFFQVINFFSSHESQAQGSVENTAHNPADTQLRAYHPDVPDMRKNYAKYHDAMKRMDGQVGAALKKLEAMGLAENTIVIHNSDHGGVLPRSKRYLFQSGLHTPLIIRIPERYKHLYPKQKPGMKVEQLVSFVDMPKTWLSLAGSQIPETMQGVVFLGPDQEPERDLHFAFRGRMDERVENARAVCDGNYLYIRNYMPYVPWMQHLDYLWKMKASQAWEAEVKAGRASEVQARFFSPKGWTEELYDMQKDPDNINNLIGNPEYGQIAARMRAGLRKQQIQFFDSGLIPECEMVKRAKEHNLTIYDMVRDPNLYDVPALLDAADLALAQDPKNIPVLIELVKCSDAGLRYWGVVGCFLLNYQVAGKLADKDESHAVRAMAAWLLIRTGEEKAGLAILEDLIESDSYAMLLALNITDWIEMDKNAPLIPVIAGKTFKDEYELFMQNYLTKAPTP